MKFYIATSTGNALEARILATALARTKEPHSEHINTCRWWNFVDRFSATKHLMSEASSKRFLSDCAERDLQGVFACDALIHIYTPENRGAWVEHGAALALGKPVLFVAHDDVLPKIESIFTLHPLCKRLSFGRFRLESVVRAGLDNLERDRK